MTEDDFFRLLAKMENATVLELGTKRSIPERPTHHRSWLHPSAKFIMSDFQEGLDVDVVCDIQSLGDAFARDSIDVVIACSVFEHVQRPWIAAHQIARVLKPGGMVFVQTHQSFPIHGYPNDYWRYTTEALTTIFEDANLETINVQYHFPAQVVSEEDPNGKNLPAFLNTDLLAKKPLDWVDPASTADLGGRVAELEAALARRDDELNALRSQPQRGVAALRRALIKLGLRRTWR